MPDVDVVIVGGGISGLSAARELCRTGLRVRLLERDAHCGGVIQTRRVGDCVLDVGPDTLLASKPAAVTLCQELGLAEQLVEPRTPRTVYLLRSGTLRPLPETSMMGLPADWTSLVSTRALTWRAKLRMAGEVLIPRAAPAADESIASFVRRRFGREAVTWLAEPLLAGIHRGDASRLSMRALFPSLLDAEQRHGSVIRALSRKPATGRRAGSMTLRGGLGQLVERLEHALPSDVVITGADVRGVRGTGPYAVALDNGRIITAEAVLFATPAHVTARLIASVDLELARLCESIEYVPSVTVALAYAKSAVRHPLRGWGFVAPAAEGRRVTAVSWISSKWPHRAPPDQVLIRASMGSNGNHAPIDQPDDTLVAWADHDLRDLLGMTEAPIATHVCRWPRAMPQFHVGHSELIAGIERRLSSVPGLFISAAGFRGVGIPDCISDAQATARALAEYVRRPSAKEPQAQGVTRPTLHGGTYSGMREPVTP
jgi:protoporphyrinogen/coproporphyrinogen III oxidase